MAARTTTARGTRKDGAMRAETALSVAARAQGRQSALPHRGVDSGAPQRALSVVLGSMSEKQFQRYVVDGLKQRGYLVWVVPDMRRTAGGLPDIIAVHAAKLDRRVLFWELKTQTGRVRPAQRVALAALQGIPGVDARIVRPGDWAAVSEGL